MMMETVDRETTTNQAAASLNEVIVRAAGLADLAVLLKFEQAIIDSERPFDPHLRSGDDVHYYDLRAMIAAEDVRVVVAELGSDIIGSGYARIENSKPYLKHRKHAYLGFMYVVPEHRGNGVNRRIVDDLEAWSVSQGVQQIRLEVYASNVPAIKAYEKAEYVPVLLEMQKSINEL